MDDKNYSYEQISKDKNKLRYKVSISSSFFKKSVDHEFEKLSKDVKIKGFRPGKAPKKDIEDQIMPKAVMSAYNSLLPELSYKILLSEKLNPIGHLHYDLEADEEVIKQNKDTVIYYFEVLVRPEIDSKSIEEIKTEIVNIEDVKDSEVDDVIRNLARKTLSEDDLKKFSLTKENEEEIILNDELVSKLGFDDKTLASLRLSISGSISEIKKQEAENSQYQKLSETLVNMFDFYLPHEIVEEEVDARESSFRKRLSDINISMDNYLQTQNKKFEELRSEWESDVEKRLKFDLILLSYVSDKDLNVTDEEVNTEISRIEDKDIRKQYETENGLAHIRFLISKDKAMKQILEISKDKNKGSAKS